MGFYADVIIPIFYDTSMDSSKINEGRKSILNKITEVEILEIGFGTGINIKFYPENVKKIVGIEINKGMLKQFNKKSESNHLEIQIVQQNGEKLPFPDNSIKGIVSTYTLCSINNINLALSEIFRVLKPGGKYYFLEHGLADNPKIQKWQHRLNPFQKIWAGGCHLNRDINFLIVNAGFKILDLKNYYMERDPKIVGYMYEGIAVK
jgi:ubiquinone/menaquinone biosynthesis C-methylase UbiE